MRIKKVYFGSRERGILVEEREVIKQKKKERIKKDTFHNKKEMTGNNS